MGAGYEPAVRSNPFYLSENRVRCKQKILVDVFLADILLGNKDGMRENKEQWQSFIPWSSI
jgi:hypothetical protein